MANPRHHSAKVCKAWGCKRYRPSSVSARQAHLLCAWCSMGRSCIAHVSTLARRCKKISFCCVLIRVRPPLCQVAPKPEHAMIQVAAAEVCQVCYSTTPHHFVPNATALQQPCNSPAMVSSTASRVHGFPMFSAFNRLLRRTWEPPAPSESPSSPSEPPSESVPSEEAAASLRDALPRALPTPTLSPKLQLRESLRDQLLPRRNDDFSLCGGFGRGTWARGVLPARCKRLHNTRPKTDHFVWMSRPGQTERGRRTAARGRIAAVR